MPDAITAAFFFFFFIVSTWILVYLLPYKKQALKIDRCLIVYYAFVSHLYPLNAYTCPLQVRTSCFNVTSLCTAMKRV